MNLFQSGKFILSSGVRSDFNIDCDSLTDEDIETLARIVIDIVGSVSQICSVPTGGDRLTAALGFKHAIRAAPVLIVDDVLITGRSMEAERLKHEEPVRGVVIFARAPCPRWITPLFQFWGQL